MKTTPTNGKLEFCKFPETIALPAEGIQVILFMVSLFQETKSNPLVRGNYYAI